MFCDPKDNVDQFQLDPGMVVADLGAGSGHYAFAAAKAVAPNGRVYAVDVQRELLLRLKTDAKKSGVQGIEILVGDLEMLGGTKIREASVDRVIASNVFFLVENKQMLASEIQRILKPGGKALIVDWSGSFNNMGPHPDKVFYKDAALEVFKKQGFLFEREITTGAHHYGIIFRKK